MFSFFCCDWMFHGTVALGMLTLNLPPTVYRVLACTCCISRCWLGGGAESQQSGQGRLACNVHSAEPKGSHLIIFLLEPSVPCQPSATEDGCKWLQLFSPFFKKLQFICSSLIMQFQNGWPSGIWLEYMLTDVCPLFSDFCLVRTLFPGTGVIKA